jgi:hypothetical protein
MSKLKMLVLAAMAAATVGTGALAAAPSASAQPIQQPTPTKSPCVLHTNLGDIVYPHYSEIVVIKDRKWLTYRCNNGTWELVQTLTTPTPTYTGSLATVVTRV